MVRKIVVFVVSVILFLLALQFVASESGEVVELSTLDIDGQPVETRLWVVDLDGDQYLRAGSPQSGWYARLRANPRVGVARGDVRAAYDAHPEPERREEVNELMRQKYGWADQVISMMFGRDDATPIRLQIYFEQPIEELPPELSRQPGEEGPAGR